MSEGCDSIITCAKNDFTDFGGSLFKSPQTSPLLMSFTPMFLTLNPTLSPGMASVNYSWCISILLTSLYSSLGAKKT
jgi:hypothetical protein